MNESQSTINTAKLLVVEDNPVLSFFLEQTLIQEGYHVIKARNGREAIDLLIEDSVDLILSDVVMPQMNGAELCSHIRQVLCLNSIPFIVLSASEDAREMARVYSLGVDDYLTKPCQPELLLAVIRNHINRSRLKNGEFEQKLHAFRRRVLNTLSHEFRTPLMAINAGTEVLLNRSNKDANEEVERLLLAIRRGGERLTGLVNDFMTLHQIEAGLAQRFCKANVSIVSVEHLLRDLKEHLSELVDLGRTDLRIVNCAHGQNFVVCETQIIEALRRVIENSLKFGPPEGPIEVVSRVEDNLVYLSVFDRGIGFDCPTLANTRKSNMDWSYDQASNAFVQLNRDVLEQQGGGFGLAIARGYAEIHGGVLLIERRSGGGSVVTLRIPIHGGNFTT